MKLVITEKPDVARNIAKTLNITGKKNGYIEGGEYIISWCVGHLVELAVPEAYGEHLKKWKLDDLPIIPEAWKLEVKEGTSKQFSILKELMGDKRVDDIICATDAGREGELIFRLVYEKANCKKPFKRLWVSSMEASAILKAFDNLRDGKEYDNLHAAALCRSRADWLIGMNLTRLYTVAYKCNRVLPIGRVQTPTLSMVVDRQTQVDSFIPKNYYVLDALCGTFKASLKVNEQAVAVGIKNKCNNKSAIVTSVKKESKKINCPKLYDLGSLQGDANKIYGYSLQQTLDLTQSLYEKAFVTYPRTDSQYLTTETGNTIADRVAAVAGNKYLGLTENASLIISQDFISRIGQVVNDSKVTDHHAIIPTLSVGKVDNLPESEKNILTLICTRFLSALSTPYEYETTTVIVDCEGEAFKATGITVINEGWKSVEHFDAVDDAQEDGESAKLPQLSEGQEIDRITVTVTEKETKRPNFYTERELLKEMERAGGDIDAEDKAGDFNKKGIGTPATRAGIVEGLIKSGFITRDESKKVKRLMPTALGKKLISIAPEELTSAQITSEWEYYLYLIEQGKGGSGEFLSDITEYINKLVKTLKLIQINSEDYFPAPDKEVIGTCPRCGGNIYEGNKNYYCSNYNAAAPCNFAIWKEDKFFSFKGVKQLTKAQVKMLLKDGLVLRDIKARSGATYNARFSLDISDPVRTSYKQEFIN